MPHRLLFPHRFDKGAASSVFFEVYQRRRWKSSPSSCYNIAGRKIIPMRGRISTGSGCRIRVGLFIGSTFILLFEWSSCLDAVTPLLRNISSGERTDALKGFALIFLMFRSLSRRTSCWAALHANGLPPDALAVSNRVCMCWLFLSMLSRYFSIYGVFSSW